MKWVFLRFNISSYDTPYGKAGELAKIEVKIGTKIFLAWINKDGDKFELKRFVAKNKRELAGMYLENIMTWWLEETFKKKRVTGLHSTERFSFLKSFADSKDLKCYFEFEKEPENQLTLDVVESVRDEIEELVKEIELQTTINIALETGNKELFMQLTQRELTT